MLHLETRRQETSGFTDNLKGPFHGTLQFATLQAFVERNVDVKSRMARAASSMSQR